MERSVSCAVTTVYHVEVSGWDTSQSFFVEKAELEWNDGGEKLVALRREVRDGAILFVRLLQPISPDRSHPIPYATERAGRTSEDGWQFRLKQVAPRPNRQNGRIG